MNVAVDVQCFFDIMNVTNDVSLVLFPNSPVTMSGDRVREGGGADCNG